MYAFEIEVIFCILPYLWSVQYPATSIERLTGILHSYIKNTETLIVILD